MNALSADELVLWVERTSDGWQELVKRHPEVLGFACDVRETRTVAELLQHIVAVELRYAERLAGRPETAYEAIRYGSGEELFATHGRAMAIVNALFEDAGYDWEEELRFETRSSGAMRATRRTVLVHALMHSVRHYAQLATLVRQQGIAPGWPMDYLFMGATTA